MRTITIELPDNTPIISLMQFAAQIKCDMKLVEHNRFRFSPAEGQSNVVRMQSRPRAVNAQTGPGAA
ncbi:hypothetical protein GCM10011533_30110 [Streptosporangium jomthongense]|uniref:Uncharacterized protein n=1 Tax=Marinobacter aromaticivorans TaxID=1494078 RepID=A0ABW2IXU2_9GAMM|nr:hypothetical protein [Marinobacter aromaticivorans]GGE75742.1 hypothetical protein GCM10011533_30110 [Streptosporangium jomthongense]